MNKPYQLAAVMSAAAVLSMGAAFTSLAATGWVYEDEGWVYLDSDGDRVTDEWKKSGDNWFYLDSDGLMAKDSWIDDGYYVNEDGAMLTNQWIYSEEGDEGPNSEDSGWYYLGSSGKITSDTWKAINGQYYCFDSDGKMYTGWHFDDDNVYYLGNENDGARKTGWLCLEYDSEDVPEEGDVSEAYDAGDGAEWFYFQSNGRMVKADSGYTTKTINGYKYYFDENGVMLTGWAAVASAADADSTGISKFKYFGEENDGAMAKGWKYLTEHPSDSDDASELTEGNNSYSNEDDGYWYYFATDGTPKYFANDADTIAEATSRINSNGYFFDEYGRMQYGLIGIDIGGTVYTTYFGNSSDDGKMKTGKQTSVYDADDEKNTYYFNTSGSYKGSGFTGTKDGYLYSEGILVKAEEDSDYQVFCLNIDGTDHFYLVNESGKVQTSSKNYKSDGEYKYQYSNGTIYLTDSDGENPVEVTSGDCAALPSISYDAVYTLK